MKQRPVESHLGRSYIDFLDGFRGVAILGVFLYHVIGVSFGRDQLEWCGGVRSVDCDPAFIYFLPFTYGFCGVPLFFVVSGFCIHLSCLKSSEAGWGVFLVRRWFRIYPPYVVALVLFSFVPPWGNLSGGVSLGAAWTHVLGIHNGFAGYFFGINPSFWSIAVELQLYLLYPILSGFVGRFGWLTFLSFSLFIEVGLRGIAIARDFNGPAVSPFGSLVQPWLFHSPFAYWFSWSLGAYLADSMYRSRSLALARVSAWPIFIAAIAVNWFSLTSYFGFTFWAIASAIVVAKAIEEKWIGPNSLAVGLAWRHLLGLGSVSYSFYLLHQPILGLAPRIVVLLDFSGDFATFGVCCALYGVILALAKMSYNYCELPSIEMGKMIARRFCGSGR